MMNAGEILIHAGNYHQFATAPPGMGMGLVPRDYAKTSCGSMEGAPLAAVQKIPRSDWPALLKEQTDRKARCSDFRNTGMNGQRIPSRDQNGRGYCWAHSTVSAALIGRAKDGQAYADLSAYAIACIIKNYRDQGGWNGESMKFLRERGCPTSQFWAQKSTSSSNDNAQTWANAALHKLTEWADIPEGDFDMQATYCLLGNPHALDLNWWSHSICGCDLVDGQQSFNAGMMRADSGKEMTIQEFDAVWETDKYAGAWGLRIWNSWADSWSDAGMGVLTEGKARNNGAIALLVTTGSMT